MSCPHCKGLEDLFDARTAAKDLRRYHRKGPRRSTRLLLDMIRVKGAGGATLLDVGGGVGVIQHELVEAGVGRVTDVDASAAYLATAQAEAGRRGYAERASYVHGDFVDVAAQLPAVDIVTLDRVVCCYPDFSALVSSSSAKARRMFGLVYPRNTWVARLGMGAANLFLRLQRSAFRTFVHPTDQVEALLEGSGWSVESERNLWFWRVVLFERRRAGVLQPRKSEG